MLAVDDGLVKRAEIVAQIQGIPTTDLIDEILMRGLDSLESSSQPKKSDKHVPFPIFTSKEPGVLHLTPEAIKRMDEEDDLRTVGLMTDAEIA